MTLIAGPAGFFCLPADVFPAALDAPLADVGLVGLGLVGFVLLLLKEHSSANSAYRKSPFATASMHTVLAQLLFGPLLVRTSPAVPRRRATSWASPLLPSGTLPSEFGTDGLTPIRW